MAGVPRRIGFLIQSQRIATTLSHVIAAMALAVLHVSPAHGQVQPPARQEAAPSADRAEAGIFNGATLYSVCAPAHAATSATGKICRAYILGAVDGFRHLQFIEQRGAFCFGAGLKGQDITAPFVEHLHRHPELHSRPAAQILRNFLIERFPC